MQEKISQENWNYAYYSQNGHRAFISLIGEALADGDFVTFYGVTVTNQDEKTIYQRTFLQLEDALELINNSYISWTYTDPTVSTGDSCSTCVAH